jgi:hypothetical protein
MIAAQWLYCAKWRNVDVLTAAANDELLNLYIGKNSMLLFSHLWLEQLISNRINIYDHLHF